MEDPAESRAICFVHQQYNSPMDLYSEEAVAETLAKHTRLLTNGAVGVDFRLLELPHLARSEVLKMVDEEQRESSRKLSQSPSLDETETITGERRSRSRRVRTHEEAVIASGLKELATKTWCEPMQITWPPPPLRQQRSAMFSRNSSTSPGVKRVAWPPQQPTSSSSNRNANSINHNNVINQRRQYEASLRSTSAPPRPPAPEKVNRKQRTESIERNYQATIGNYQYANLNPDDDENMDGELISAVMASNELVGERSLIAKPLPPPGLVLNPIRKTAPFTQEPNAVVTSNPVFKRPPARMLGNMVWPPKREGSQAREDEETLKQVQQSPKPTRRQKDYRGFFSQNQLPAGFPTYRAPPGTQHFGLVEGENSTAM